MSVAVVQNLTVRYGQFTALDNLSVEIPAGCTGLLGPNGAGKTTLIKTILGFVKPSEGTGHVLGLDIRSQGREIRQAVGLMPEQDCHLPGMSAVQFVSYAGELAGMPRAQAIRRAHEVLEYCGLGEARYRNVETYSTGMKQRIKLAQALVHGPKLLLLDEPTNGLDPNGRVEMLELIRSVSHGKGVNVIVSSHLLPDIEQVCDEVVVVVGGKLRDSGKIADLKKIAGQPVDVELRDPSAFFVEMADAAGFKLLGARHTTYRFQPPDDAPDALQALYQVAEKTGTQIRGFAIAERSLEEAFLEAVNR
ncbi:MAG: ABC transporter ATP-binding protein [Fimbriimonadaceae bacterium]